tara:strand:+ start:7463 stop:9298 length:1836 start_codon:yes stop_codon:yes gene_type:complete
MAESFFDRIGLNPEAGGDAGAFAENMDKSAKAMAKFKVEADLGYKTLKDTVSKNEELLVTAKKELKQREKDKKGTKRIQKQINKLEATSTKLSQDKSKLEGDIAKKLEKQNKIMSALQVGFAALVALFAEIANRQAKIRDEFGITLDQANKLLPVVQGVTADLALQGITFEKSSKAAKAIYDSTKSFAEVTKENVANVALVSKKFGVSAEHTAEIAEVMKQIGGYSIEQSTNMVAFASAAAEAAGIAPDDVMADIAKSAETAAKFFGDNPKALAKAAIEARRLGLTLDDMASVASGLLEIESSIENQFTAQVLTGKQFNFDAARRLALEGDIEGATKSILSQMGSIDEFNKMDVIQKKAIADASGLSVKQLSESLTKQKALTEMSKTERAEYDKYVGLLEDGNKSDAQKLIDQKQSLAVQEQFNALMTQLKEQLINDVLPIFMAIVEPIGMVFKFLGGIAKFLGESKILMGALVGLAAAFAIKSAILAKLQFKSAVAKIFAGNAKFGPLGLVASAAGVGALIGAISSLPALQEGGITTGETMAMIGDNPSGKEMVVPLEKADEMGFGGNTKALETKLDTLIAAVQRPITVVMDGTKVGEGIYRNTPQSGAA